MKCLMGVIAAFGIVGLSGCSGDAPAASPVLARFQLLDEDGLPEANVEVRVLLGFGERTELTRPSLGDVSAMTDEDGRVAFENVTLEGNVEHLAEIFPDGLEFRADGTRPTIGLHSSEWICTFPRAVAGEVTDSPLQWSGDVPTFVLRFDEPCEAPDS